MQSWDALTLKQPVLSVEVWGKFAQKYFVGLFVVLTQLLHALREC